MPPRLKEICELLQQGSANGTIRWAALKSSDAFSATVENATFVIAIVCYPDGEPIRWTLRILSANGDELDTAEEDADDEVATELSDLWNRAKAQNERPLAARLQPIAEALRASVLGGSK
jgi:hypothetical protein